jgi:hypothetical protein
MDDEDQLRMYWECVEQDRLDEEEERTDEEEPQTDNKMEEF